MNERKIINVAKTSVCTWGFSEPISIGHIEVHSYILCKSFSCDFFSELNDASFKGKLTKY